MKNTGVVWSKGIFATATEGISLTVKVSGGVMENSEVEL
jgi:hypothetical protein